jgi:DNA-binding CsgD family transcriptional regulator
LYGEWLRRGNRRVDARRELNVAYELFSAMGMKNFAERTRRELLATGATVHKRNVETRDDLTAQEAQIARLARLSNPEVGAQLFISARTGEWHLAKAFSKLGISSRRQLRRLSPNTGSSRARRASALEQYTTAGAADSGSDPQAISAPPGSRPERSQARDRSVTSTGATMCPVAQP